VNRLVSFATGRERNFALAIELEAAVIEGPLDDHLP
jgi:hypothetical protein